MSQCNSDALMDRDDGKSAYNWIFNGVGVYISHNNRK